MSENLAVPIVIDTNVLVPSLYAAAPISRFLSSCDLALVWNDYIWDEVCEIIQRLSFRYQNRGVFPSLQVQELFKLVASFGIQVPDMPNDWLLGFFIWTVNGQRFAFWALTVRK